eukprot:TRINITY_DN5794_c0_g1_i2.p1 TRINITY_DN5794_c0_g1~~TRINITY_DN5794_c0_g1_i2.p1  ORF type:complete len:356 (-),score=102.89 TRINITY_DN5794_c0_g1_i2:1704-2771(-)
MLYSRTFQLTSFCLLFAFSPLFSSICCQVLATHLARLGLRVDLSDSVPAAALALRQTMNTASQPPALSSGAPPRDPKLGRWDVVLVDIDADGPGTGMELGRMVQQLFQLHGAREGVPLPMPRLVLLTKTSGLETEARRNGFLTTVQKPLRAGPLASCLLQLGLAGPLPAKEKEGGGGAGGAALGVRKRQLLLKMTLKGRKVLVVDEEYVSRKGVALTLAAYADVSVAVDSGSEALQRLQHPGHGFDLVLLDLMLSDLSSFEVVHTLRKFEAAETQLAHERGFEPYNRVPIFGLYLGGGVALPPGVSSVQQQCKAGGMDGALLKPIDEEQLLGALSKLYSGTPAPEEAAGGTPPKA